MSRILVSFVSINYIIIFIIIHVCNNKNNNILFTFNNIIVIYYKLASFNEEVSLHLFSCHDFVVTILVETNYLHAFHPRTLSSL